MTPAVAADLFRAMLLVALRVGAPLLAAMTATAVLFGVIQAATQVQDAAISFTPKLAVALVIGWLTAAWFTATLSAFMHQVLNAIPVVVAR
jgi:flagellar biosynthesis protein FliQ